VAVPPEKPFVLKKAPVPANPEPQVDNEELLDLQEIPSRNPVSTDIRIECPMRPTYARPSLPVETAIRDGVLEDSSTLVSNGEERVVVSTLSVAKGKVTDMKARLIKRLAWNL